MAVENDDREPAEKELEELFRAAGSTSQMRDPAKAKAKLRIKELEHNWNIAFTITGGMQDSVSRFVAAQKEAQSAADDLAEKNLKIANRQFWASALAAFAATVAALATVGLLILESIQG